jgi:hypothetical protein
MNQEMHMIRDCRFVAREICNDIKHGVCTEEQGKEALFRLLLTACGAKVKEPRK